MLLAVPGPPGVVDATPFAAALTQTYTVPPSGSWSVTGRGYGHARGLGQWSAQGAALAGWSAEQIVNWAYPGTSGGYVGTPTIRVRLSSAGAPTVTVRAPAGAGPLSVTPAGSPAISTTAPYVASATALVSSVDVASADGVQIRLTDGSWTWYRGTLRIQRAGSSLTVTNHVNLRDYVYGVVPRESPSWFHPQALRAQALVARSYALAVARPQDGFDICDTSACQVYGGRARVAADGRVSVSETAATNAAVDANDGWILTYGGAPAFTQFSASTGGWTRAGTQPYLVAQPDPWSGTAPKDTSHRWRATLSAATVQRSCPAGGRLTALTVTARDGNGEWGGRVTSVRLDCSTGSVTLTGDSTLRFGMQSSWWSLGSTPPMGFVDAVRATPGQITVTGWAGDVDAPTGATRIGVYVDGVLSSEVRADQARPDVPAVFPALGAAHGYSASVRAVTGSHTVCVRASGDGEPDVALGCRDVTVPAGGAAFGVLDSATAVAPGWVRISGWAADPDPGAVTVRAEIAGATVTAATGRPRPDVSAAFPGFDDQRGFEVTVMAPAGTHRVCAWADDVSGSARFDLGCRQVTIGGGLPNGSLDSVVAGPASIVASGWAWDPDAARSAVAVRVDVTGDQAQPSATSGIADRPSPHLSGPHPATGENHGFRVAAPAAAGSHQVCVRAVDNAGPGEHPLGCRAVTVSTGAPFGYVDTVTPVPGGLRVTGWATDPDSADPVDVHVYLSTGGPIVATARGDRPDVARVFPGWSAGRGFDTVVSAPPGPARVCVYAIDRAPTGVVAVGNPLFGCRDVIVR